MPTNPRNLIVFHEKASGSDFYHALADNQWHLHVAKNLRQAIELLSQYTFSTGLCLIDTCDNKFDIEQLIKLFNYSQKIHWVMALPREAISDNSVYSRKCELIANYCHDYLMLPVDHDRLLFSLGHAYGMAEISLNLYQGLTDYPNFEGIIGNSQVMRNLFKQINKVCKEDLSVLIEGETGTGKELIANAIHTHSKRAGKPIVAINCGAFPHDLIHSELFGYEKGAFTGAQQRKIGRIESAQGGTLFLDEIGDLPLIQQVNLLRFLEERSIERVGGTEKIPIDVRIISATHVDLKEAVKTGKFREDLYYRLRVLQLNTPPLRERENDIELLAMYFFNEFSKIAKRKPKGFCAEALYLLQCHDWPGNIRELMNCIRHAVIMSETSLITPADLGLDKRNKTRSIKTLEEARADADRETILASMRKNRYNMSRAAENLGISRVSLYRLLDKYGIKI